HGIDTEALRHLLPFGGSEVGAEHHTLFSRCVAGRAGHDNERAEDSRQGRRGMGSHACLLHVVQVGIYRWWRTNGSSSVAEGCREVNGCKGVSPTWPVYHHAHAGHSPAPASRGATP